MNPLVVAATSISNPVSVTGRLWTANCGLQTADCRLQIGDCGLRTADCGLRTADCGLRTTDCGLWTADCGLGIADCGLRIHVNDLLLDICFHKSSPFWNVGDDPTL